jgi:micrococcal nuclease
VRQRNGKDRAVRRCAVIVSGVLVAALVVTAAQGAVRKVSLTTPVRAGDEASLTVTVSPRARCTIEVIYDTVVSRAQGLRPKTGSRITWRWRVGTNTNPGRWPIIVKCGNSGTLRTKIRVLPG